MAFPVKPARSRTAQHPAREWDVALCLTLALIVAVAGISIRGHGIAYGALVMMLLYGAIHFHHLNRRQR